MNATEDEPQVLLQPAPITGWRTAWSAFRTPHHRLEALLTASVVAVAYLLCLAVAGAVAAAVNALAVEPALKAAGWTLNSGVTQLAEGFAEGAAVGGPVFFGIVWLALRGLIRVQPVIDRWMEGNRGA